MVLNSIKILTRTFLFLLLVLFFSCERWEPLFINCDECESIEPEKAKLEMKLSENKDPASIIEVRIFEGNLEDCVLYDAFNTQSVDPYSWVLINKKYTVTARYIRSGRIYIVVDAVTPLIKYDDTQCEEPCYYIYNNKVDLRLKY